MKKNRKETGTTAFQLIKKRAGALLIEVLLWLPVLLLVLFHGFFSLLPKARKNLIEIQKLRESYDGVHEWKH